MVTLLQWIATIIHEWLAELEGGNVVGEVDSTSYDW